MSACTARIHELRATLTAGLSGVPEDVSALEHCMSMPAVSTGRIGESPILSALANEIETSRDASRRMWKRSMDVLAASDLTEACEALVEANAAALGAISDAYARMSAGSGFDPEGFAALQRAVDEAIKGTGEGIAPAGLGVVVAAPTATSNGSKSATVRTPVKSTAAAAAAGSSDPATGGACDDASYNSPAVQHPAVRSPIRLVSSGPAVSPLPSGMGTPTMEDFGLSAAGLAALGGEGADAAVTASALASVMRDSSRSRTAGAADDRFFHGAHDGAASGDGGCGGGPIRTVGREMEEAPEYLRTHFPMAADVNRAIDRINEAVIAAAEDQGCDPADARVVTHQQMESLFGSRAKGLVLLLIHLKRFEVRREGRDTSYLITNN